MIEKWFEPFTLLESAAEPTGLGSVEGGFNPLMSFQGAVSCRAGSEVNAAGQLALEETLVLLHEFDVTLRRDDYVRREQDGAVYRVISASDSMRTPAYSGLRFCQVNVERVVLPC